MMLLDVASYQSGLTPEAVRAAGFSAVNFKISHGLGAKSVHADLANWVERARAIGLGLSSFHWLTADAGGVDQADYAFRRMAQYGLAVGAAHQLDVESTPGPTLKTVRDYLTRMTSLLGRPVALYTGDWWWKPRGWDVSDLAPYLWSAPNAGYLGSYPGDTSSHWTAGYGGWPGLAVMQYAVQPVKGTTIKASMSAIRDPAVWRHLTTGRPTVSYAPDTIMAARKLVMDTLRGVGVTVNPASFGVVGDDSHAKSGTGYHLGKDALKATAYSVVESRRDRDGLTNAASAFDVGWFSFSLKGKTYTLRDMSLWIVAQCKAGAADTLDLRDVIYSPDGKVVKRWDRLGIRSTGDDSHLTHTHLSYFRDSERRDKTALFRRWFTEIGLIDAPEEDVTKEEMRAELERFFGKVPAGADNLFASFPAGTDKKAENIIGRAALSQSMPNAFRGGERTPMWMVLSDLATVAAAERASDADAKVQVLAAIQAASTQAVQDVLTGLGDENRTDAEVAGELRSMLRAALGNRADSVISLMRT